MTSPRPAVTPPPAEAGGFSLCRVGVATDQPGPFGLSPRQIAAVTVTATGCTALVSAVAATALGLPLSYWLIDAQGKSSGIGAGIARGPSPGLLLLFTAASTLGAAALAVLPAVRAGRRRLTNTLSAMA
ncbi:hypothetical protein ACFVW1_14190 [Streptomyces olivochromogenes]|uniref:hypothetical protein n=1 Tax=Streptomyces TaxID=1883 RepID=UPI003679B612